VGSCICFRKTRFAWRDGKDEDVFEVYTTIGLVILPDAVMIGIMSVDGFVPHLLMVLLGMCTK
jgi:hypothetical protein